MGILGFSQTTCLARLHFACPEVQVAGNSLPASKQPASLTYNMAVVGYCFSTANLKITCDAILLKWHCILGLAITCSIFCVLASHFLKQTCLACYRSSKRSYFATVHCAHDPWLGLQITSICCICGSLLLCGVQKIPTTLAKAIRILSGDACAIGGADCNIRSDLSMGSLCRYQEGCTRTSWRWLLSVPSYAEIYAGGTLRLR